MPAPLPNVPDLVAALVDDSDARDVVAAFLGGDIEESRRALRELLAEWEMGTET